MNSLTALTSTGFVAATGHRPVRSLDAAVPLVVRIAPQEDNASLGFSALRGVIAGMVTELSADAREAEWLRRFHPELVFLYPTLKNRSAYRNATPLSDIAVGPSRRRLHKESEQIFRVTQAIVHIILRYAAFKDAAAFEVVFDELDRLDEQSLRVFMRLAHCAADRPGIKISGRLATRAGTAATPMEPVLKPFLTRNVMRDKLIDDLRQRLRMQFEELSAATTAQSSVCTSHTPIEDWGSTAEGELTAAFLAALAGDDKVKLGVALLEALESSVFTQNYDHAQWLVEQAAPMFARLSRTVRREVLIHLGILHAFTRNFPLALNAMEASFAEADTAKERAESTFFMGLLLVKRMDQPEQGRGKLHEALAILEGEDSPEADCERAWLYNVMALSYVTEKKLKPARESCRRVLAALKSAQRSPDATHIKINIISNLTMLDEFEKNVDDALARWNYFDPLLSRAGPVFGKHHLFRKAGLLIKLGQWKEAISALEQCYGLAQSCGDVFYGDVIARGIAGTWYRHARYDEAAEWYEKSLQAKADLLEDQDAGRVALALALAHARAGLGEQIEADLVLARPYANGTSVAAERLARGIDELQSGGADRVEKSIEGWATPLPETKLNRPFEFTNLY